MSDPIRLVYAGRRFADGKVRYTWFDPETEETRMWNVQLVKVSVGVTVDFTGERSSDGNVSILPSSATNFGWHDVPDQVVAWRATDLDAEQRQAQKALITKAAKIEPLDDILAPIARVAPRLTKSERRALAVRIMEVLYT